MSFFQQSCKPLAKALVGKTLKVGDVEVAVVMIPARQAFALSKDVAQVAVQLIGALGKLGTKSLDVDLGAIGPELGAALAGIESTKLDSLLAGLLAKSEAKVNGPTKASEGVRKPPVSSTEEPSPPPRWSTSATHTELVTTVRPGTCTR